MAATLPITPQRSYGWRTPGEAVRELLLGVLIGWTIIFIEVGGADAMPSLFGFARNGVLGLFCILGSRGLETALSWAIEQSNIPTIFRTIIYVAGGWAGFLLGLAVSGALIGAEPGDFSPGAHFVYMLSVVAMVSVLTGLILHHNRKRNDRLRANIERLKEHEFAEKELEIAREMQHRLLAPPLIERDGFRVTSRTEAAHIVGGDFYDVLRLPDGATAVIAADVSGKGIAASLIMASCKAMIPFLASTGSAADVMDALNASLCDQLQRREFVAMVFVRFDPRSGRAEIANAGMPDPLITGDGSVHTVICKGDRVPLGAMRTARYDSTAITLGPGQGLMLFSDGLPEAHVGGTPIGYDHIEALAARTASVQALVDEVRRMPGIVIEDDVTVVKLEVLAREGGTEAQRRKGSEAQSGPPHAHDLL
jgi:serine phosphatase RsbU (regulator of sigma subunit)